MSNLNSSTTTSSKDGCELTYQTGDIYVVRLSLLFRPPFHSYRQSSRLRDSQSDDRSGVYPSRCNIDPHPLAAQASCVWFPG